MIGCSESNGESLFISSLARPFTFLTDDGFDVDVMTLTGGKTALYSTEFVAPEVTEMVKSKIFSRKISHCLTPDLVELENYSAIFIPGFFMELYNNKDFKKLMARAHENGIIIGSCDHGTAALTYVTLGNGTYLVKGKSMGCYPDWAEKDLCRSSGYGSQHPFSIEQELKKNGALLQLTQKRDYYNDRVICDPKAKLVTGAFSDDDIDVIRAMIKMIE